ncbi:MAG: creatininase family protein, partial [Bdellovibrionales bacterium]|nr:creatininase family protein [Bdellovibrionales bacterium]
MPLELSLLTDTEIRGLDRAKTLILFPVGPFESHGPHIPVGADLAEALELCRRTGARIEMAIKGWTAVVAPAAPLGIDSNSASGLR